jgi:hypothetical protein
MGEERYARQVLLFGEEGQGRLAATAFSSTCRTVKRLQCSSFRHRTSSRPSSTRPPNISTLMPEQGRPGGNQARLSEDAPRGVVAVADAYGTTSSSPRSRTTVRRASSLSVSMSINSARLAA